MVEFALEPISKKWYDYLNEGKMMGLRCKHCGHIMFPPVPVCGACGKHDMEWTEVSGEAELVSYSFSPEGVPPFQTNPTMIGMLKLKEGDNFMSWILGVGHEDEGWMFENLPLKVKGEIVKISEEHNLSYPVYRIVDQEALSGKKAEQAAAETSTDTGKLDGEKYEQLMGIIAAIADVDRAKVTEESRLVMDLDYSSMRRAMLCADLEDAFDVSVPQGKIKEMQTVGDLIAYLKENLK